MNAREFFGNWMQVIDESLLNEALSQLQKEISKVGESMICPKPELLFKSFSKCQFDALKVVIVGQSPYPQEGVATGLAFANDEYTPQDKWSPSLKVIYDSMLKHTDDLPFSAFPFVFPEFEQLEMQGVLLYNAALSCRVNEPESHRLMWRNFSKKLLNNIAITKKDVIFALLGSDAEDVGSDIDASRKVVCAHPSYYARTNQPMPDIWTDINVKLRVQGKEPICWI